MYVGENGRETVKVAREHVLTQALGTWGQPNRGLRTEDIRQGSKESVREKELHRSIST